MIALWIGLGALAGMASVAMLEGATRRLARHGRIGAFLAGAAVRVLGIAALSAVAFFSGLENGLAFVVGLVAGRALFIRRLPFRRAE